ncbi:MAG TPA: hypothetical protein VGX50_16950, partial [Longimicrobium sp.]|nr:hypothetical protein [Longimicrobium sp.]
MRGCIRPIVNQLDPEKETMQSFGEQHIQVEEFHRAGTVRVLGIYSDSALYPRIGIRLGVTVRDIPASGDGLSALRHGALNNYEVTIPDGELRIENGGPLIGPLWRTQQDTEIRSYLHPSESQVTLACDLDFGRIEAIERHRAGRPARLSLTLWPTVMREGKRLRANIGPLAFEIPQDKWVQFLGDVKYGEYTIIEVKRLPIDGESFADVRAQLDLARQRVMSGHYNSALAALRTGLDRFYEETRAGGRPGMEQLFAAVTDEVR